VKIKVLLAVSAAVAMVFLIGCASQPPPPPIIVQAAPTPTPTPVPPDPYESLPSDVTEAIKHNQTPTLQHGITLVQPYSPDLQYPLNCQPLHVTQIRLRDDETTDKDDVKVGDHDRWGTIIGDHSVLIFPKGTNTNITVPGAQVTIPRDPNMITNLVIHTSMGNDYVFNPVKLGKPFTQKVEFYYPELVRAQAAVREAALKQEAQQR
jgi:type IV secretory pathway VirB9-like protein